VEHKFAKLGVELLPWLVVGPLFGNGSPTPQTPLGFILHSAEVGEKVNEEVGCSRMNEL
jgi:hypothetical protein